jgi:hypothetical protein
MAVKPMCKYCDRVSEKVSDHYSRFSSTCANFNYYYLSEGGSIVGGEEWQGKVYDREEWKRLLRTARNQRILHMPMEWTNE